jgi:hypothetical protein
MQILSFFVFMVMAVFFLLVVGYGLSLLEGGDHRTDASREQGEG